MKCINLMFSGNQTAVCFVNRGLMARIASFVLVGSELQWSLRSTARGQWLGVWTQEPDCWSLPLTSFATPGKILNLSDLDVLICKMGIRMLGSELRYAKRLEQCHSQGECSVGGVIIILLLGVPVMSVLALLVCVYTAADLCLMIFVRGRYHEAFSWGKWFFAHAAPSCTFTSTPDRQVVPWTPTR